MFRKLLLHISAISGKLNVWCWKKLWSNKKDGYGYRE